MILYPPVNTAINIPGCQKRVKKETIHGDLSNPIFAVHIAPFSNLSAVNLRFFSNQKRSQSRFSVRNSHSHAWQVKALVDRYEINHNDQSHDHSVQALQSGTIMQFPLIMFIDFLTHIFALESGAIYTSLKSLLCFIKTTRF